MEPDPDLRLLVAPINSIAWIDRLIRGNDLERQGQMGFVWG
jgi:hypothetical protein